VIIVTGTKRSGTSMWMQILSAAGFPVIGEAFPMKWERTIEQANPAGFYESKLRQGVFHVTNPNPRTGAYLHPKSTKRHAVKVFIPGLVRTDYAFLFRVLSTMRDWREYTCSLERLHAMEDEFNRTRPLKKDETEEQRIEKRARVLKRRGAMPPPIEWWFETYELVRDVATRRYPFHLVTYRKLLDDPETQIDKVLNWIGSGDRDAAIAAVKPSLRTQKRPEVDVGDLLDAEAISVFDDVYDMVHEHGRLDAGILARMNALHARLEPKWSRARRRDDNSMDVTGADAPAPEAPASDAPAPE
jgi:hypothetical protein